MDKSKKDKENKAPKTNKKEDKEAKATSKSKETKKEKKASSKSKDKKPKANKNKEEEEEEKIKRPMNAYMHFCAESREEVKKENPDAKAKDILHLLGDKWKALSEEEKKKYNDLAAKDKERYEKECKEKGVDNHKNKKKNKSKKEKEKKGKKKKTESSDEEESDEQ